MRLIIEYNTEEILIELKEHLEVINLKDSIEIRRK